jgi:hypothetical protein
MNPLAITPFYPPYLKGETKENVPMLRGMFREARFIPAFQPFCRLLIYQAQGKIPNTKHQIPKLVASSQNSAFR